jgi:hypothetical protein
MMTLEQDGQLFDLSVPDFLHDLMVGHRPHQIRLGFSKMVTRIGLKFKKDGRLSGKAAK